MAAVSYRGTPSQHLAIPPSQNTASVLEFRCLFTHDIFKKQKKWHDGSLRFHTFNRRVMVYDDAKNLVGDLHYRDAEDFAEGLELQLDKPVKVLVEEQLGQSRTDLTSILGRQKQDGIVQRDQAPSTKLTRPRANTLQGKPKSIKELLGASQGHLGRAMLPQRSPFEQRQSLLQTSREPPPKRQKLDSEKENAMPVPAQETSSAQVPLPTRVGKHPAHPQSRSTIRRNEVIDLSSLDDDPTPLPPVNRTSIGTQQTEKAAKRASQDPGAVSPLLGVSRVRPRQKEGVKNVGGQEKRQGAVNVSPTASAAPVSETYSRAQSTPITTRPTIRGPRTLLMLTKQSSRRKLLYKALLPDGPHSEFMNRQRKQRQSPPGIRRLQNVAEASRSSGTITNVVTDLDEPPNKVDYDERLSEHRQSRMTGSPCSAGTITPTRESVTGGNTTQSILGDSFEAENPSRPEIASPLFVPQTISQVSQGSAFVIDNDDFCVPSPNKALTAISPVQRPVPNNDAATSTEHSCTRKTCANEPSDDQVYCFSRSTSVISSPRPPLLEDESCSKSMSGIPQDLLATDKETPSPSPVARPLTKTRERDTAGPDLSAHRRDYVRQVLLENAVQPNSDPVNPSQTEWDSDIARQRTDLPRPLLSPEKHLQRATSDPTAMQSTLGACKPGVVPLETTISDAPENTTAPPSHVTCGEETGPWTTMEAFLLFEWWPPEKRKNKPDFGQVEHEQAGITSCYQQHQQQQQPSSKLAGMETRKYGMFGSARFVSQR